MNSYVQYVIEQLTPTGSILTKAMFGGFAIYKDSVIVGLIIDDQFYLKTNEDTEQDFRKYDSEPFTYNKNGKIVQMSYWKVPGEVLENKEKMADFVYKACKVSLTKLSSSKTRKRA
jgi:DNA transformation protein